MSYAPPSNYIFNTKYAPQPPSLKYVSQSVEDNVALSFDIPFPVLKAWNEFLDKPENEEAEDEEYVNGELSQGPIIMEVFHKAGCLLSNKMRTGNEWFDRHLKDLCLNDFGNIMHLHAPFLVLTCQKFERTEKRVE